MLRVSPDARATIPLDPFARRGHSHIGTRAADHDLVCSAPKHRLQVQLADRAKVGHTRWPIEDCLLQGEQELGQLGLEA